MASSLRRRKATSSWLRSIPRPRVKALWRRKPTGREVRCGWGIIYNGGLVDQYKDWDEAMRDANLLAIKLGEFDSLLAKKMGFRI